MSRRVHNFELCQSRVIFWMKLVRGFVVGVSPKSLYFYRETSKRVCREDVVHPRDVWTGIDPTVDRQCTGACGYDIASFVDVDDAHYEKVFDGFSKEGARPGMKCSEEELDRDKRNVENDHPINESFDPVMVRRLIEGYLPGPPGRSRET
jgi:hypothetical protein